MKRIASIYSLPILLASLASANTGAVSCDNIVVQKQKYDFSKLDKVHTLWVLDEDSPPAVYNTTWSVNICTALKVEKETPEKDRCRSQTNSRLSKP
jgi:hypothetical protein